MEDLFQRILKVFGELGLWRSGVQLVGSWSFLLYQRHLGVRSLPLRTQDVDFLIPWPFPKGSGVDLSAALGDLGFRSVTTGNGSMYFAHPELRLEFLVPERGKGGMDYRLIQPLGVRAVPLRYLDMLLKDPIKLKEAGVEVGVPKPLNYCLHKLIIAQRRTDMEKREKDILHAAYVLEILTPKDFRRELDGFSPKWRRAAEQSLAFAHERFPLERPTLEKFMRAFQ